MKVLFLILNYKTYKETVQLTKSLYNQGLEDNYILIVDNASPNDSYKMLIKQLGGLRNIEVVASPENGGFAKGNNYGLRYAKKYNPKYVCIINNDVMFSMTTIDNLCRWYEQLPFVGFISPIQMLPNGKEALFGNMGVPTIWMEILHYTPFRRAHRYVENTNIKGVQDIGIIPGAFTFTSYSRFEKLGFFDESTFLFCEERFIAKKAQQAGLKNYIILNETYLHAHSLTIRNEASEKKQRRMIFEGRCLYYKKYSRSPLFCVLVLWIIYVLKELYFQISRNNFLGRK